MPSDTQLPPVNPPRPRHSPINSQADGLADGAWLDGLAPGATARSPWIADPRMRAALCYAFPIAPAAFTLWRERRDRRLRLHAAQALLFFLAVALAQIILFIALIALGNVVGPLWLSAALGVVFLAAYAILGIGSLVMWLRLLNSCLRGGARRWPALTPLAARLETASLDFAQAASARYHARRNGQGNRRARRRSAPDLDPTDDFAGR